MAPGNPNPTLMISKSTMNNFELAKRAKELSNTESPYELAKRVVRLEEALRKEAASHSILREQLRFTR